jgi:hypothetical protein
LNMLAVLALSTTKKQENQSDTIPAITLVRSFCVVDG